MEIEVSRWAPVGYLGARRGGRPFKDRDAGDEQDDALEDLGFIRRLGVDERGV